MQPNVIEWRGRASTILAAAKFWWGLSFLINFSVFAIALLSIATPTQSPVLAVAALLALALNEVALGRVDTLRSHVEQAKAASDLADSFGTPYPTRLRDLISLASLETSEIKESYFKSARPPGTLRAAENLIESSWWSKQLATMTANLLRTICASVVLVAFITLLLLLTAKPTTLDSQIAAQFVVAGLALLYSLGLFRIANSYASFAADCHDIWLQLIAAATTSTFTESNVSQSWRQYHISRALAPMIPSFLWRVRRDKLAKAFHTWSEGLSVQPRDPNN